MPRTLNLLIRSITNSPKFPLGVIGLAFSISFLLHLHALNIDLVSVHVWRQTETQTVINNFYKEDFNILNPRINYRRDGSGILRKEFPIMQWLFACFYKVFGEHIIISRLLTLWISFFSIFGLYQLLFKLSSDKTISAIGAWCLTFSPAFFYYSICPLPDNFALCLSIWGTTLFLTYLQNNRMKYFWGMTILLMVGTLAKLPYILFYAIPVFYFIQEKNRNALLKLFILAVSIIPVVIWYALAIPTWNNNGITTGIISNQMPISTWFYYLFSNLFSVFPELLLNYGSVGLFLIGAYFTLKYRPQQKKLFLSFLVCVFCVCIYFLFEINMIKDMHDYYLFPFLPFLFIVVAYGAKRLLALDKKAISFFVIISLCLLPLTTFLRMQSRWKIDSPGFNKDLYTYKNELRTISKPSDLVVVGNDVSQFIFLYYIDRKGWVFNENQLDAQTLQQMIQKGAKYLYTDSKVIQEKGELKPNIEEEVFHKGSIIVYKLKG
ncbi:MAG: glycosyltransferase family 39 protein [Chitinophagales bacterium]